jgi:hypothetical protein
VFDLGMLATYSADFSPFDKYKDISSTNFFEIFYFLCKIAFCCKVNFLLKA